MQIPKSSPGRSHGLKLIVVCFLVLLMAIPAMFISYVSFERSNRADSVTQEVSKRYGGPQHVSGPLLVVPYTVSNLSGELTEAGDYVISPETGQATIDDVETTIRKRSLFKVPTYRATIDIEAIFNSLDKDRLNRERKLDWDRARLMVGVSDGRGLTEDIFLTLSDGTTRKFEPAAFSANTSGEAMEAHYHKNFRKHRGLISQSGMTFLSVPASGVLSETSDTKLKTQLVLGGATKLGVLPFAKSTSLSISSDWTAPGFEGGFAPVEREIGNDGFSAKWSVPYLARGVLGESPAQTFSLFNSHDTLMAVRFVAQVNPYQTVNRALKYAVMFIGLVFIAYFLFEVLVGVRVHPAQYILIGLAQSIFYLLLLAFSEHLGFSAAFVIAALATVGITAGYAGAVFGDKKYIARAGAVFALVYGLLYTLMRLQDFALMIGSLASFMAIALTMYLTRHMDWYGVKDSS